jgi:hypothetical protein
MKYFVVLFKNKVKKRIINKFKTYDNAKTFFKNELKNNTVVFDKKVENGKECNYEIALLEKDPENVKDFYVKDELGRQTKVEMESNYGIIEVKPYKVEDFLYDVLKKTKIDFNSFEKSYLKLGSLKLISKLNNKIVVQNDDDIALFSLKSDDDCFRFLTILIEKMNSESRIDVLIVMDTTKTQKKYLYDLLEKKGIPKSVLYRRYTTFPK